MLDDDQAARQLSLTWFLRGGQLGLARRRPPKVSLSRQGRALHISLQIGARRLA
jgi:hypothetical protein